jgi:hypothetical protein
MATKKRQDPVPKSNEIPEKDISGSAGGTVPKNEYISIQTLEDRDTDKDKLGFDPYVKAIAKFLTSKDTKPPLVLSVEGEWGSGKTSFMRLLNKQLKSEGNQFTIWFNPWRHDKEEALWAAFALSFVQQLTKPLLPEQRILGRLKRFIKRFNWKEGWLDLALKTAAWTGLLVLLCVLGWMAFSSGDQWVENVYKLISGEKFDPYNAIIETGIKTGGIAGLIALLFYSSSKLMPLIEDPLKMDLRKYISSENYEDRVSFVERFHADFKEVLDIYAGKETVYVFIDDLDRCEVPKAADLMSAINLMLSDDPRVVFIIGMDREKVAAGLAVKHEKILPYILASRTYNRSNFSNKELVGLEFGYEFIEKFIQLPFRIPQPDAAQIENLLTGLSQNTPENNDAPSQAQTGLSNIPDNLLWITQAIGKLRIFPARKKDGDSQQPATGKGKDDNKKIVSEDVSEKDKRRENIIVQIGPESDTFRLIIKAVAPAFDYNPRRVKQFINLLRLRVYIAAATGLFDEELNATDNRPLTLEQIAKFTALELRWPLFLSDIEGDMGTLLTLQDIAHGIPAEVRSPRVELWQGRQDLMNFLNIDYSVPGSNIQNGHNLGDLSANNLMKLLKVSRNIRELKPFVPKEPEDLPVAPTPTPNPKPNPTPNEPAEYIIVDGKKKYNLAGEFCVAFIGRDNIHDFLSKWKSASPTYYKKVVDNDQPTGIDAAENMLSVYGYNTDRGNILKFREGLTDPGKRLNISSGQFKKMLETYYLMVGVRIDVKSYNLRGQGIGIWVVLDKMIQNDERVEIYNPYLNQMQEYSFDEFIKSMGGPPYTGLWAKRQTEAV